MLRFPDFEKKYEANLSFFYEIFVFDSTNMQYVSNCRESYSKYCCLNVFFPNILQFIRFFQCYRFSSIFHPNQAQLITKLKGSYTKKIIFFEISKFLRFYSCLDFLTFEIESKFYKCFNYLFLIIDTNSLYQFVRILAKNIVSKSFYGNKLYFLGFSHVQFFKDFAFCSCLVIQ